METFTDFIEDPLDTGTDSTGSNPIAGASQACKPGEDPIDDYWIARRIGCRANRLRIERLAHSRRLHRCEKSAPDQLGDLRDNRIAEAAEAVHSAGNPMSHSTHVGFNCPPTEAITAWSSRSPDRSAPLFLVSDAGEEPLDIEAVGVGQRFAAAGSPFLGFVTSKLPLFKASLARGVGQIGARKFRGERPAERSATAFVLLASGVGNNPDPVSSVRRTNGTRWNAMPFRVIPDLGQVPENGVQPSTKQSCHVLQHRAERSYHANGSNDVPVQSRTGSGKSGAGSCETEVLTWEARSDDIRFAFGEFVGRYVLVDGRLWPMAREDASRRLVDFAEGDSFKTASSFEAEREPAYAAEQIEDAKLRHATPFRMVMDLALHGMRLTKPLSRRQWTMRWTLDFDVRPMPSRISSKLGA